MSYAEEAIGRVAAAMADPMRAVAAAVTDVREAQQVAREARDSGGIVETFATTATLILALERLSEAAGDAEKACRLALAAGMAETGATTVQGMAHTISLREASRRVVVTDEAAVPPALMVTPPPKPDLARIAYRLRNGESVPGVSLTNGGAPTIQIRKREHA